MKDLAKKDRIKILLKQIRKANNYGDSQYFL